MKQGNDSVIGRRVLSLVILVVVLAPRLAGLKSFVAVDEPAWLSRGGNFYYALGQREFEKTVYEYHPAVTTMWLVTLGFLTYFPEYRGLGQGYFNVDKEDFDPYLIAHGRTPLDLLFYSRLFQVALIAALAVLLFHLLARLLGTSEAFLVTAFVSSAPLFLGYSRVLDHEAMVVAFSLTSILALDVFLERGRQVGYLLLSGAAAALANLTKSPAIVIVPVAALMLLVAGIREARERGWRGALAVQARALASWGLSLLATYVLVWPGMWVAPRKMLFEVYGNAFSYAFQGARLEVTEQLQPSTFSLAAPAETMVAYIHGLLWRSTPVTWIGWLLLVGGVVGRNASIVAGVSRRLALYLFMTAVLFVLLFSFAQGRNSPHYILTSHASLSTIAALGWLVGISWFRGLLASARGALERWIFPAATAILITAQLASAADFFPYYYTYYGRIAVLTGRAVPLADYGEGFEQAAAFLAEKSDASELSVLSFRGRGPFSYFFPGETILLNPLFLEEPRMASLVERLEQSDYLVFNDALPLRTRRTAIFGEALAGIPPQQVIRTRGAYDIRIYRVAELPPSFFEAIAR